MTKQPNNKLGAQLAEVVSTSEVRKIPLLCSDQMVSTELK